MLSFSCLRACPVRISACLAVIACVLPVLVAAETPRLDEKVVVHQGFGPASEQFGRTGLENVKKTTRIVTGFAASADYIAIPDRIKRDVKIFTTSGVFERAIPLRLTDGKADTVRARDVAIDGETLYVLVDDLPEGSKVIPPSMRIATFDIPTGQCTTVRTLDTSSLVPTDGKASARGADAYLLHPDDGHLWLVDSIRQMGFEILFPGKTVAQLAAHPVYGWGGNEHRFRTDDSVSSINLLGGTGELERRLPESGVMVAVSNDGGEFAVLQYVPIDGKLDWGISVYDAAGDKLAMTPRPNRSWRPFKAPIMERKYELVQTAAGPELYELYANADGVSVARWAR